MAADENPRKFLQLACIAEGNELALDGIRDFPVELPSVRRSCLKTNVHASLCSEVLAGGWVDEAIQRTTDTNCSSEENIPVPAMTKLASTIAARVRGPSLVLMCKQTSSLWPRFPVRPTFCRSAAKP
jgi:hypothetical protein